MKFQFPVGFQPFHENNLLNFQLNRWYSLGIFPYAEVEEAAKRIRGFEDAKNVFKELAEKAIQTDAWLKGATYLRAAEFFSLGEDPEKGKLYDACMKAYKKAYAEEPIINEQISYEQGYLPVMRVMSDKESKGWIVLHGGYDSFIQELYPFCRILVDAGYDVIMFEGPGQGEALNKYGMKFIEQWEKPVTKVLDHYGINNVTLLGISLGGYLAARAAAYEKRVQRVILYDIIYDFYQAFLSKVPLKAQEMVEQFLPLEDNPFWKKAEQQIAENLFSQWLLLHGYHVFGVNTVPQYLTTLQKYNTKEISKYITQDVLLLAGEEDIYTQFFEEQKNALINAKSVSGRIFTKSESASHHCQIGNIKLAFDYMLEWLEGKRK